MECIIIQKLSIPQSTLQADFLSLNCFPLSPTAQFCERYGQSDCPAGLPFSRFKIVVLNKGQVEDFVNFSQVQNETSIMIMGTII